MEKSDRGRRYCEGGVAAAKSIPEGNYAITSRSRISRGPSGKLQLAIDKVFKLDDIRKAFEHMEANKHLGKIAVTF